MKKSFHIIYYTPRFYPAIAGAEFYFLNLATQMQRTSHKVQMLCSTSIDFKGVRSAQGLHIKKTHPNYKSYKNIQIERIAPEFDIDMESYNQLIRASSFPIDLPVKRILQNGPNHTKFFMKFLNNPPWKGKLIHSSYIPYATVLFALIYSRIMNIPSVCTPFYHMNNPRYQNEEFIQLLSLYDRIITCTQEEKEYLIRKGISAKKLIPIPMGVNHHLYEIPRKTRSGTIKSFKKVYGIKQPFILFCGYKNHEKGAISVLHAATQVKSNLTYVFIGPSTAAFDIELKKARKLGVTVLNLTPNNLNGYYDWRKISAFRECEFFIMPSRSDAYGIAYLEAWASKKAVIGADTPVMREVIQNSKDGLLVEFDNIPRIAESIRFLLNDTQKSHEMGLVGYSKVKQNNTWEYIHRQTMDVYDQLVDLKE